MRKGNTPQKQRGKEAGTGKATTKEAQWEPDEWRVLQHLCEQSGTVIQKPWTSFSTQQQAALRQALLNCPVQVAGNAKTTAWHANEHKKLPKQNPGWVLKPGLEGTLTPYVEFLIPGKKKKYEIERAVFDRETGAIYNTAL
jgi:hypothetical protein